MAKNSKIEWCDHTWNPWYGCHKVSAGCKNCYMFREQKRWGREPNVVQRANHKSFDAPLKWKNSASVFTCSWSDFFIQEADQWRAYAWDIIRKTPHLTYLVLTKRPERIDECLPNDWGEGWPNVWLGVSVENKDQRDRISTLQDIPAIVRFVSCEPLLTPLNLCLWLFYGYSTIDWVITGGESGPGYRPANPDWFRSIRDQCAGAGVAYFHKQNGGNRKIDGAWGGRELDGKVYNEFPMM